MKLPPLTKTEKAVMGGAFLLGIAAMVAFKRKVSAGSGASSAAPAPSAGRAAVPASQSHGSAVPHTYAPAAAPAPAQADDSDGEGDSVVADVGSDAAPRTGGDAFTADVGG